MASTASNATSAWPTRLCICGAGPCIPRKSGSRAKHTGKWYYDCPGDPPCREWNGWCNESIPNIAHSQDDSMSSPGGGRGKGNWSTPRKAILQPSEERNFSQVSPLPQFSQSYEQPHFSRYYDQPNFDQAAQEANFAQHTHTSMLSPSVGRGRGMRASPHKTFSHASRQPNFSSQDQQFWQPSPQIFQPTSSPSRGRGRGIGTSPRKAVSQPSQHAYGMQHSQQPYFSQPAQNPYTNTIDRAKWTSLSVKSLLEACADEIDENGRAVNGFSKQAWARILNAVMGKTGRKFTKKQLKDKHDRLKEEWKAWILVAEDKRQTGLGRNPETGAITGPDHWWDAMIARNSHVAKFRNQGLEHEGLMGRVFRDITAMGNEAIFPGEGIEEIGEGSGDSEGMHVEGGSVPQSQEQYQTSVSKGKHPIGQTSTVGGSHSSRKRKWTDVHEAMSASFAESVDRFKSTPSIVINRSGKWGIENAIRKLDTLPMFQVEGQNLAFHSWACRLFERQQHKIDIFCEQKSMADAIQWLRDEHSLAEDRYYTTPPGSQRRGLQPPPFPHVPDNVDV